MHLSTTTNLWETIMENKSLFTSIILTLILVTGFFFYNDQVSGLENEIDSITVEYNSKIEALQPNNTHNEEIQVSTLDDLNSQLVSARSALREAQQKLLLATSKTSVLGSEISQIHDARGKVKSLEGSLKNTQQELELSGIKLDYLESVFELQNKATIKNNIARIKELKETSTGIALAGFIVPAVGVATLISYTVEEIHNYCGNIKNAIDLEEKVFGKIISLDTEMQNNYHQQCVVSLKDQIKEGLGLKKI